MPIKIGLVGAGEVTQTIVLPNLRLLSDLYEVNALCDISQQTLEHVSTKFNIKQTYTDYTQMIEEGDIEAVMVLTADEYHAPIAVEALQHKKAVFVEKPMALSQQAAALIIKARDENNGVVFVGYQRRYSPAFEEAVQIVRGMSSISYCRVRDIIGPNSIFVGQSGTFPRKYTDFPETSSADMKRRSSEIAEQALGSAETDSQAYNLYRLLGSLGSHDLSAMRELLGIPKGVCGVSNTTPSNAGGFFTAMFDYGGFVAMYETGVDQVGLFDAHIEVYGDGKRVKVEFDTPYVKGLPVKLVVGESDKDGRYIERVVRPTYEDAYTIEYKTFYDAVRNGKQYKTTADDARCDLEIFKMITDAFVRQDK
ncbi:hypothetical protein E3P86_01615 [Wallemia ichthyophaga]|uniref:Gfo/Idh/MocA-like oxidoreductase N-terminal domain-containing protein n=1 Tax=Wallemia ichthyophaga TaxID=245174 RepID=A0A4T0JDU3_WALIC|nr:hypothetical protein E3P86_01615 [Wallemia ichthyophaga]